MADKYKWWKPKSGLNKIRIIPPEEPYIREHHYMPLSKDLKVTKEEAIELLAKYKNSSKAFQAYVQGLMSSEGCFRRYNESADDFRKRIKNDIDKQLKLWIKPDADWNF